MRIKQRAALLAALQDVIRNGYCYSEPTCVLDARQRYLEDNSTVITFFHECMVPRKHKDNCTTGKLYDVYRAWCVDNNNGYAETARAFRDKLCEYLGRSYKELTIHTENGTCYRDYTLSLETKQQYVRVYGYDNLSRVQGFADTVIPEKRTDYQCSACFPDSSDSIFNLKGIYVITKKRGKQLR